MYAASGVNFMSSHFYKKPSSCELSCRESVL